MAIGSPPDEDPETRGRVIVMAVGPDSPVAMAGLLVGDVITAVEGQPVTGGVDSALSLISKYHTSFVITVQRWC